MLEKQARKPRQDPAQEELLRKKDEANASASVLIKLWIDLKRAWNGWPVSDLGINDRSDIKHPLPDQINQAQEKVRALTDDILQKIDNIQQAQASYSRTRRISKKELSNAPVSTAPQTSQIDSGWNEQALQTPENVPGLAASLDVNLIKEGSNIFSRMLSYITSPFDFKDENRWERLKMLRASAQIKDLVEDIDNLIVSQSPNTIPTAIYKLKDLFYLINNDLIERIESEIDSGLKNVEEGLKKQEEKTKEEKTKPSIQEPEFISEEDISEDLTFYINETKNNLDKSLETLTKFEPYVNYYGGGENLNLKLADIRKRIMTALMKINDNPKQSYNEAIVIARDLINIGIYINDNLIPNFKPSDNSSVDDELYSLASGEVSRWFKRYWLNFTGGRDKTIRQAVDQSLDLSLKEINKLMDILEKRRPEMPEIVEQIFKVIKSLQPAYEKAAELADIHNSFAKIERSDRRQKGKKYIAELISFTDVRNTLQMARKLGDFLNKMNNYKNKVIELETKKSRWGGTSCLGLLLVKMFFLH